MAIISTATNPTWRKSIIQQLQEQQQKNDLKSKQTDLKINLDCMLDKCRAYEEVINDLKGQNTCLIDEHTALQILYDSLKNKFDKLNQQYNDLVTKVMEAKAKDAEIMNEENEKMIRLQQERLRKQLEDDANRIMVTSNVENDSVNLIENPVTVIIPERPRINFEPHNEIYALKFDKKTNYLSSGGGDRKVKLWNFDDIKINLIQVLTGSNASVTSIDIFEEYLVASSSDYASRVWTLNDFRLRRTLTGHSNKVMSVKFMSVNNKVVSGSYDKTIKVWDLNRNACMRTLFAGSSCTDIANRDENFFASGHIDKHIRFWDSRIETSSATGIQLQGKITSLNVTNNGHYLVAAIRNVDKLTCLDLRMNSFVQNYTADSFTIGWDWTRLCLSPNDQYIACGGNDSQIFFWDFSSGKLLKTLSTDKHIGTIIAVEWHPKGNLFASADQRNVLDDLLDNGDDEDFDAELKAAKNFDRTRLATTTTTKNKTLARNNNLDLKKKSSTIKPQSSSSKDNGNKSNNNLTNRSSGNNGGGNNNDRKQRRSKSHESSRSSASCQSQYSCDSGSCSCEDHSSITGPGENVEISKREGVWSTPLPNEMKLNSAFREFRNVILIFSVKESGKFQGFARLSSEVQYDLEPVKWVLPPGIQSCPFGGIFFIDWICRNELPFTHTSHLYNAFNESKPVKIARDGQEIEPKTGEELCRLFPADDFVDLIPMLKRMKKQTLNRPRKRHSRGPFMDSNNNNAGSTTTTTRHDSYRNKTSLHLSSSTTETTLSLHSIK
ncbi:YTH domain-containing protein 1 [Dermatophagoides pteronyssinus]|uniref:YTH domain-containing protein 1 n=1 Tax=Dermatophagoides pteronyssinus TaxID=6956 RepID=A0ABQ8JLI3_DERPT|nr:YTH domain-containing protein 1 [Dermatophagoides pteronyssinus]